MSATLRRRSPRYTRKKSPPKTDVEKLEERIDLILKISGGILDKDRRYRVTKAISMSFYGALAERFDELSKSNAVDLSFTDPPTN